MSSRIVQVRVHPNDRVGFTLTELLIAIALVAILAGILFSVVGSSLKKAERVKAQNDVSSIVAAIKAYYGEYGKMPTTLNGSSTDTLFDAITRPPQAEIITILRGIDHGVHNPAHLNNRKKISYLTAPSDSLDSNGSYLDPWGNAYLISLDTNFDSLLDLSGLLSSEASAYVNIQSPAADGKFPGITLGVMSLGPPPSTNTAYMIFSWL